MAPPWVPRGVLKDDGVTLHPFYFQRSLGSGESKRTSPLPRSGATSSLTSDPRDAIAARVDRYLGIIAGAAAGAGIPLALLQAVIHQESGGDPTAYRIEPRVVDISCGLMQLLMGTARGLGYMGTLPDLFDPTTNISLGTRLLGTLYDRYTSEELALVAYNGGPGAAAAYKLGVRWPSVARYARTVLALSDYYTARAARAQSGT